MASTHSNENIRNHRDLRVWQVSVELVVLCYRLTGSFPKSENYGLSSQLQRAAVSIPANIAEGHGRHTTKAYLSFISIAAGSLSELDTHLELAVRLNYTTTDAIDEIRKRTDEVGRMLTRLRCALEHRLSS